MTKRFLFGSLLLCVALLAVFMPAGAQNQRTGTAAASELLIPVGARDLAMGGSTIANSDGVESIFWNPAGLGHMKSGAEGMFSSMSYIADISVSYGAVAAKFGEIGTFGFSVKTLAFGDIPLTTVEDPEGLSGRIYAPTYMTLGLSYGRKLTESITAGFNVKMITEKIDRVDATGMAFDLGVQYDGLVGVQGLQLGVTVKNIGPQLRYSGSGLYRYATSSEGNRPEQRYLIQGAGFELPSLIEIGVSYVGKVRDNMVYSLNGSFTNNNLYLDEYRLGGEYGFLMKDVRLFGRAGYSFLGKASDNDRLFGATFGFGLSYDTGGVDLTLDYAYRDVKYFSSNNVFSLKLGF